VDAASLYCCSSDKSRDMTAVDSMMTNVDLLSTVDHIFTTDHVSDQGNHY